VGGSYLVDELDYSDGTPMLIVLLVPLHLLTSFFKISWVYSVEGIIGSCI